MAYCAFSYVNLPSLHHRYITAILVRGLRHVDKIMVSGAFLYKLKL